MNSCLYECRVMHRRLSPRPHHFVYRIFMFAVDLDELPALPGRVRGIGYNTRHFYSFRDRDHLAPDDRPIRAKLQEFLQTHGITLPANARVRLLTLPRVLGYIFNPVSFFYCYDADDRPLCSVVEVGNTFREMKLFLIPSLSTQGDFRLRAPKEFYVSPFSTLDTHFDFRLSLPADRLSIQIDDYKDGALTLVSSLSGPRAELTTARLWSFTLKYPLITLRVIFLIHWHALRLWFKGLPFIRKTDRPDMQKDVLRPHSTLSPRP